MNDDVEKRSATTPEGALDVPAHSDGATHSAPTESLEADAETQSYPHRGRRLTGPRRKFFLVLGISLAVLLTVGCVGILFYRWVTEEASSAMVVVTGAPSWMGATATVSGPKLRDDLTAKFEKFEPGQPFQLRFHVPPGAYSVRVEKDGKLIDSRSTPPDRALGANSIWWPFDHAATVPSKDQ